MSSLNTFLLPENILTLILSHINSLSQLQECRLVSKAWSNPSLTQMLGQEIVLQSEISALRLYDVLTREPSRACLIKHLHIDAKISNSFILKQLLLLALTPNIETIRGKYLHDDFFIEFNQILARRPQGFKKLRMLPSPDMVSDSYANALWSIRDSLRELVFDYKAFQPLAWARLVAKLPQCKNLTRLEMIVNHGNDLGRLEVMLNTCPYIEELAWYLAVDSDVLQPSYTKNWFERLVKKQQNLLALRIQSHCPTDYLQYLLYKYPNLVENNVNVACCGTKTMIDLKRIIGLMGNDPNKVLILIADPPQDFCAFMKRLAPEYKYKINTDYDEINDCIQVVLYANAW